jgi:hypothetical protein
MKLAIFKSVVALAVSLSMSYLAMPDVRAENEIVTLGISSSGYTRGYMDDQVAQQLDYLNKTYLNNALSYYKNESLNHHYQVRLPGKRKRFGVFMLEKDVPTGTGPQRAPLVLDTKKQTEDLCTKLQLAAMYNADDKYLPPIFAADWFGAPYGDPGEVIAVAYSIAYNKGFSQAKADGTSTTASKYKFCQNPYDAVPGDDDDENDATGIINYGLRQEKGGNEYDVTCFNPRKKPTTFWLKQMARNPPAWTNDGVTEYHVTSSSPSLHQLNEQVGSCYCDSEKRQCE